MVALSPATARALGYLDHQDTDEKKTFVEVSGRRGQGVKADDLLDRLVDRARAEVTARNPELDGQQSDRTASAIAVAAVRYFMIKFSRTKVIAFDIDEALSFEGETGPYLQYAVVRANNIFHKLFERDGVTEADIFKELGETPADEITGDQAGGHDLWALVLEASRLDEIVEQVVRTLEFSVLAKYAFGLAQAFNAFYHRYSILNEDRRSRTPLARGRCELCPKPARPDAGPHGHRGSCEDVRRAAMAPVIGISACRKLTDYLESVRRAGGDPRVLDVTDATAAAVASVDGLLLTGGEDVDPARYGQTRPPHRIGRPRKDATSSRLPSPPRR